MGLELGIISLVILIFSAILHEIMHGLVAERLGDPTARLLGRITLNPIPHIDPYMSILLPAFLILINFPVVIGGAKPVPVDPFNLKDGRRDLALVSLAGPATNFVIAIGFAAIIHLIPFQSLNPLAFTILFKIVEINLVLGIFNLIPIPPLDGSKIFSLLLPEQTANAYMNMRGMGFLLIFGFLYFGGTVMSTLLASALHLLGF